MFTGFCFYLDEPYKILCNVPSRYLFRGWFNLILSFLRLFIISSRTRLTFPLIKINSYISYIYSLHYSLYCYFFHVAFIYSLSCCNAFSISYILPCTPLEWWIAFISSSSFHIPIFKLIDRFQHPDARCPLTWALGSSFVFSLSSSLL